MEQNSKKGKKKTDEKEITFSDVSVNASANVSANVSADANAKEIKRRESIRRKIPRPIPLEIESSSPVIRDAAGRFLPGVSKTYAGVSPYSTIQRELKEELYNFLIGKIDNLDLIWDQLSPQEQGAFFIQIAKLIIPGSNKAQISLGDGGGGGSLPQIVIQMPTDNASANANDNNIQTNS